LVLATTPTLITPVLGVATATSINKVAITAPATSATLTLADGKTLTCSNTLTFTGTDASSVAFGTGGTVVYTSNKLSVHAATTSAELAGVISDETGSGALVFGTSPTFTTSLSLAAAAETRYYNAGGTFYVGFKGGNAAANKIWTLPLADGSANQVLSTDGSGTLSWATGLTSSLNQYNVTIGNSSNTATSTNTNLLGDVKATSVSQTFTITIASPGVATATSHGLATGDKVYLTTSGALPTGLSASTTYFVSKIDADTFKLSTTLANAVAATCINTSGSQSGTHTIYSGGFKFPAGDVIPGRTDGVAPSTGYVGQYTSQASTADYSITTSYATVTGCSISLTAGVWWIHADAACQVDSGNSINLAIHNGTTQVADSLRSLVVNSTTVVAMHTMTIANITATATYALQARASSGGVAQIYQVNSTAGLSGNDCATVITAVRIA
jgi:hypothetical protein